MNNNFKSIEHAMLAGMLLAHLRQLSQYVEPILDDNGDHTPRFIVRGSPFGQAVIEVLPPQGGPG